MDWQQRIELTTSCNDCADIPKVPNAGKVFNGQEPAFQLMHNGVKVIHGGYFGQHMANIIELLQGHHEPQEEKVFHEVLKFISPNAVMLELGAYWSYYSLWFHATIDNATNYMLEPDPYCLNIGKLNFKLNGFNGRFARALVGRSNCNGVIQGAMQQSSLREVIPQISLDSFMTQNIQGNLAILHSDIQGNELEMLLGAAQSLRDRKIDFLLISTHSDDLHFLCLQFLHRVGYITFCEHSPAESFSIDGLIAAKAPDIPGPTTIPISKFCPARTSDFE